MLCTIPALPGLPQQAPSLSKRVWDGLRRLLCLPCLERNRWQPRRRQRWVPFLTKRRKKQFFHRSSGIDIIHLHYPPIGIAYGTGPPECCAVPFEAIKNINLSRLECEGYSSAYSLAPLRVSGPTEWSYGIRVKYSVQGSDDFCRGCVATGGTCGYGTDGIRQLCMCGTSNSTSNCDSAG